MSGPPDLSEDVNPDSVTALVRSAGARPAPSVQVTGRVREAVYREFAAHLADRRLSRQRWITAAAGVAALTFGAFFTERLRSASVVVAHVSRVVGASPTLVVGKALRSGQSLALPQGARVLLTHTSGVELRIDEDSRITFVDPVKVRLERGAVYVETHRDSNAGWAAHLTVMTAYGEVSHVGTRFEVRVTADRLRVRVRDGATVFRALTGAATTVTAGEELDYRRGVVNVSAGVSPAGEAWRWVESAGPAFQIEGCNLLETLEWFAHEGGFDLEFSNDATRARASTVVLHGSTSGLNPLQAIEVVLNGTEMHHEIVGNRVRVSLP